MTTNHEIATLVRKAANALLQVQVQWDRSGLGGDAWTPETGYPFAVSLDEQVASLYAWADACEPEVKRVPQSKDDPYGEELRCDCGNDSRSDGFYACDADGTDRCEEGGGPLPGWDAVHYKCARCGQIWAQRPRDLYL